LRAGAVLSARGSCMASSDRRSGRRGDNRPDAPTAATGGGTGACSGDEPRAERYDIAGNVAHPSRVYDYVRGGADHFSADREAAEFAFVGGTGLDHARSAVQANQDFLVRAVTYLVTEAGVRQFLETGAMVPHAETTATVAQALAPDARVVYVNDDPVVLAHAHALTAGTSEGDVAYIDTDCRHVEPILAHAAATLDLARPVALLFATVLPHVTDDDDPYGIVARYLAGVAAGSYLVVSHLTADFNGAEVGEATRRINKLARFHVTLRDHDQIARFTDGLELVAPGVVPVAEWRPTDPVAPTAWPAPFYAAVARKP
jgi:hypothetical protein